MSENPWNSLEIMKIVVSIFTPLSVVCIGWFINRSLKKIEHIQWSNQKIIEKRLQLYDDLSPLLNSLLCFYTWVGYWKDVSPGDVIDTKRELDKKVHIYRHLLGEDFFSEYQKYIELLFKPYSGRGHDAKILSVIEGPDGDRKKNRNYEWKNEWDNFFQYKSMKNGQYFEMKEVIRNQYEKLMDEFKNSIGIT